MKLNYSLTKNKLNGHDDKYMARIRSTGSWDLNKIMDEMVESGSTVTKTDAIAVIMLFFRIVTRILMNGGTINTSLFNIELRIRGNFNGPEDRYNQKRHKVEASITSGKELKDNLKHVKMQKDKPRSKNPYITNFTYLDQSIPTHILVPGEIIRLKGDHLKLNLEDPEQKVILIANQEEISVKRLLVNKAKELLIQLPADIPAGNYQLEVHSKPGNCTQVRIGSLGQVLEMKA